MYYIIYLFIIIILIIILYYLLYIFILFIIYIYYIILYITFIYLYMKYNLQNFKFRKQNLNFCISRNNIDRGSMLKNGGRATLPGNFSRRLISADGNGKKKKKGKRNGDSPRRYSARHQRQLRRSLRWLQLQLRCVCKGNIPRDVARRPRALLAAGRGHVCPTSEANLPVSPTRSPETKPRLLLC